jgi:hypothetical protein
MDKLCAVFFKLFSGRFLFTIATAVVFMWATFNKMLTNEQIVSVITLVIGFYFNRMDRKETK